MSDRQIKVIKKKDIEKREAQNKRTRRAYLELLILEDYEAALRFVEKHSRMVRQDFKETNN